MARVANAGADPAASDPSHPRGLLPGVSVIVPSHRGRNHILPCLDSLAAQTLAPDQFDVIVVLNGESDGTRAVLERFRRRHPALNLSVHMDPVASASRARNIGLAAAARRHTTFVDDDDSVSPGYLETLLTHAGPDLIPFAQIVNINGAGQVDPANTINTQTISHTGQAVHPARVSRAMGFNACKLVPTDIASEVRYDTALRSGDDVVFFMTLLATFDVRIYVCPVEQGPDARNAVYYRSLRPQSLSRQAVTFNFNVIERLEVISRLDLLAHGCDDERRRGVIRVTMASQVSFISRYLEAHPDQRARVLDAIDSYKIDEFPYHRLADGFGRSRARSRDRRP